jgi:hypothetical protein
MTPTVVQSQTIGIMRPGVAAVTLHDPLVMGTRGAGKTRFNPRFTFLLVNEIIFRES